MTETIDRKPAITSAALSLAAAGVAAGALALGSRAALSMAAFGVLLLAVGLYVGVRGAIDAAAVVFLVGVVVAGAARAPAAYLLVATVGGIVAWDLAYHAVGVGDQLGRDPRTRRGELGHAAGTLIVGTAAAAVGFAVYALATGGQPVAALVFVLFGTLLLISALRQ